MMATSMVAVQEGMAVSSSDHKTLGSVIEVRHSADGTTCIVTESRGFFGLGARFFLPLTQVETILPEGMITLYCTKAAAKKWFYHAPLD